jgi:FkbM family methyltransferase
VGASHGVYTYHANRILEDADIICIEADPERFAILQENVAKWGDGSTNRIRCVNAAASDENERAESGEITFYTTGTQISGGLFTVDERSDAYTPRRVPLVCVDDYFEPKARAFIKIDVEGAELRVLKGALRHIEAGTTRFYTEISWWGDRQRGTSSLDVLRFAWSSGLRVDRRLKSDYLLAAEPRALSRALSILGCLPPLTIRFGWNRMVPARLRTWRERRENRRRLSRYDGQLAKSPPDQKTP